MSLPFIRSASGNCTVVVGGKSFLVAPDHLNYKILMKAVEDGDEKTFLRNVDIPRTIAKKSGGAVQVENGVVTYNGEPIHSVVAQRILEFMQAGLPFKPLQNFLANLMENPSKRSIEQLYTFLENKNLPITDDGCFLGYKTVKNNWKDKHSGTIDNSPGTVVKVARNSVDDDFRNQCSYGLHVGGLEYVRGFASGNDRFLIVKVNPKHAVAVPTDYNCQKLRVEEYLVVSEVSREFVLQNPLYASDGDNYDGPTTEYEVEDDWDGDWEPEVEVEDDYEEDELYTESDLDESWQAGYEQAKRELASQVGSSAKTFNKTKPKFKRDSHGRFTS